MYINFEHYRKHAPKQYSNETIRKVLQAIETKNPLRIEEIVKNLNESVTLEEALPLFTNKIEAIKALSLYENNAKPGPDAYMTGLDKEEEDDKEDQIKKQSKMDDDDPKAYKEMPGDEEARKKGKVKKSKHTKSYAELYGESVNEGIGMGAIEPFLPIILAYIETGGAGRFVNKIKNNLKAIPKVINNFRNMKDITRILNKLEKHPKIDGYLNNLDPEGVEVMFQELSMADMKIMYSHLGLDWNPKEYLEIKRKADKGEWAKESYDLDDLDEKKYIYLPKYDNAGYQYAEDLIATLRSKFYKKWSDDEFDEFRRAMIRHFDLPIPDFLQESEHQIQQLDSMAYGQLERCVDYATMIRDRYDSGYSFDSWMYGKITKAEEHLNAVFDAMDGDDGVIESSKINEDLKKDLQKFVKKNEKEIDKRADEDDWDGIYDMIYTEFDIDPESDRAKEVRTLLNLVY